MVPAPACHCLRGCCRRVACQNKPSRNLFLNTHGDPFIHHLLQHVLVIDLKSRVHLLSDSPSSGFTSNFLRPSGLLLPEGRARIILVSAYLEVQVHWSPTQMDMLA